MGMVRRISIELQHLHNVHQHLMKVMSKSFLLPESATCSTSKIPMPKVTRTSQNSRKRDQAITCDADSTKMGKIDKVLKTHGSKSSESEVVETVAVYAEHEAENSHETRARTIND